MVSTVTFFRRRVWGSRRGRAPGGVYTLSTTLHLQLVPGGDWEAALARAEVAGLHGDWETPQRAGFCFLRAALVAVRYVLRRRWGWPVARVKAFMAAVRAEYVAEAAATLGSLAAALELAAAGAGASGSGGTAAAQVSEAGCRGGAQLCSPNSPPPPHPLQAVAVAAAVAAAADTADAADDEGAGANGKGEGKEAEAAADQASPSKERHHLGHAAAAFTESDAALVALGAKQTARALAKLVARGHAPSLDEPPLAACSAAVAALADALARVRWHLFGAAPEPVVGAPPPSLRLLGDSAVADDSLPFVPIASAADVTVPAAALSWRGFDCLTHLADDALAFAGYRVEPQGAVDVSLLPLARLPSQQQQQQLAAAAAKEGASAPVLLPPPRLHHLVADCAGAARSAVRCLADIAAVLAHARAQARRGRGGREGGGVLLLLLVTSASLYIHWRSLPPAGDVAAGAAQGMPECRGSSRLRDDP